MFIKRNLSVAAGATVENILSGSVFEFLRQDGLVEIGILSSSSGLLAGVSSGADILMEDGSPVDVVRIANQGPIYPEDYSLTDAAMAGDRLRVALRNPTAGAITAFVNVRFTPQ